MKLSRRCFLSFVIGGAAGTALSPLPWKLTDDLSIWSQNWPWTPVPPDGASEYVNSTCTLCPGGCGISVRKIDQRAIKIEGAAGHPINDGGICMLGLSGLQLLYGPTRIQAPLKRVGERGQRHFKTITWDAAIAELAEKLGQIRDQDGPQTVACVASDESGTVGRLLKRFMTAYGSPNFVSVPSIEDTYAAAIKLTQGSDAHVGLDVGKSDFILSFGCALLDGYGSPVRMIRANSRLKDQHGTMVQIEPRLSNTAAKADTWLPANPGSEADLALAMAQVIIEQNKYHAGFVYANTEGFESFARMVNEKFTPAAVSKKTGIAAQTIAETALRFASAKKPLAVYGRGKGQEPGSLKEALAVHALNALVGNINQEGGVFAMNAYDYINWPEVEPDQTAATGLQTPHLATAGSDNNLAGRSINRFIDAVQAAPDKIKALLIAEANPCYALPDAGSVKAAIEKIPFVVSFSSFMDETAINADLILPNHVYLERFEDIPVKAGVVPAVVGLCRPVVDPLYHTRHLGDTIIQVARALNGSVADAFPWEDYQSCLEETLSDHWDALSEEGFIVREDLQAQEVDGFDTPSGKFELMNSSLAAVYQADDIAILGDNGSFLLVLIPYDSIRLASRHIGDPPFMIKIVSDKVLKGRDIFVEVNPDTADQLGLAQGQAAVLSSPKGQATVRINCNEGIMPGLVAMPRGLGHTAYDEYLADKGVNVNVLLGPVEDPATGLNAAWGIRAKLAKA